MIFIPIALIAVVLNHKQFIGCIALCCVYIIIVLHGISTKLQCSVLCMKKAINRVPPCVKATILSFK